MSKVAIQGNASGTGTFTIAAPNSNTDRTLTLPDEAGTVVTTAGANFTGNVGIGTSSPRSSLEVEKFGASASDNFEIASLTAEYSGSTTNESFGGYLSFRHRTGGNQLVESSRIGVIGKGSNEGYLVFYNGGDPSNLPTESMRLTNDGSLLVGVTSGNLYSLTSGGGFAYNASNRLDVARESDIVCVMNRTGADGDILQFYAQGNGEGSISVSGTTVSYNGGHLARWSRLADDSKDTSIVKGTVMTNLDEMVVWSHDAVAEVLDEEGNVVTEAKNAYTEDNEQLNKMAVSSVEGDPNVAGVFVNWDNDDDFNDMNIAMTGDMVIRIAQGTTVQRGDLLMSAGDGTAKPQGDDIVRSKTIAKVTSTHVSHTYDDGSYLVPCVLMAC